MLRTLAFALVLACPTFAQGEEFSHSPLHQSVRSHDGRIVGRVERVIRDADGNIVGVEIPGLEPADAPPGAQADVRQRPSLRIPSTARTQIARNAPAPTGRFIRVR